MLDVDGTDQEDAVIEANLNVDEGLVEINNNNVVDSVEDVSNTEIELELTGNGDSLD